MLDLSMMVIGEDALIYHGSNQYWIFDKGSEVELVVSFLDEYMENEIEERRYSCSSLSAAIASIESLENGEEI